MIRAGSKLWKGLLLLLWFSDFHKSLFEKYENIASTITKSVYWMQLCKVVKNEKWVASAESPVWLLTDLWIQK